jgi:hypothetical protein
MVPMWQLFCRWQRRLSDPLYAQLWPEESKKLWLLGSSQGLKYRIQKLVPTGNIENRKFHKYRSKIDSNLNFKFWRRNSKTGRNLRKSRPPLRSSSPPPRFTETGTRGSPHPSRAHPGSLTSGVASPSTAIALKHRT